MGRPRMNPPALIERFDLPKDMMRKMNDLSERRAWPLMWQAIRGDRSLKKAVRDVYLQGLADGYECGKRALAGTRAEGGREDGDG